MLMDCLSSLLSPPSSPSTQVIDHWLDSICGERTAGLDGEVTLPYEDAIRPTSLKRKPVSMDDSTDTTPRPKRRATGIAVPSPACSSEQGQRIVVDIKLPSLHSSQSSVTSSRSSSPSKRPRDSEITYSKPDIKLHFKSAAEKWKKQYGASTPLLKELLAAVQTGERTDGSETVAVHGFESEADSILDQIEFCQTRKVPEDTWSDLVIYPALQLARRLAQRGTSIHVISAKTVNVMPKDLLPTNVRRERIQPKRVDYTIGLTFADAEEVATRVLAGIQDHTFNQSDIPLLCDRVLCSHLEIKTERNVDDGRQQLAVWAAAGFQKMENMWLHQSDAQTELPEMPPLTPVPLWLWREDTLHLYLAVMDSKNERVHIIEERGYIIDRRASLMMIIRVMAAVMDWGYDHYLPWFKCFIGKSDCL